MERPNSEIHATINKFPVPQKLAIAKIAIGSAATMGIDLNVATWEQAEPWFAEALRLWLIVVGDLSLEDANEEAESFLEWNDGRAVRDVARHFRN